MSCGFQEGVAKGDDLDESSPGDEGHGHDEDESKHAGDGTGDHGHGHGHDSGDELDDSMSLSVSASKPPQQRYQQQNPRSGGQPGATVTEMIAPDSPQQVCC